MKPIITCFALLFSILSVAQDFKFGKVSKEELLEEAHPLFPESEAAVLHREVKTRIDYNEDKGFFVVTEVIERIKIYTNKGFEWGTVEVDLFKSADGSNETLSGLKAYTYTLVNGKVEDFKLKNDAIFEEERGKYRDVKIFTMPALEPGCVIEYRYKLKSPYLNDINAFVFQESIPVNHVEARFVAPEYFNYKTHSRGWIPLNIEKTRDERTINKLSTDKSYSGRGVLVNKTENRQLKYFEHISKVKLSKIPPISKEAFSGNLRNYTSSLKFELSYTKFPTTGIKNYSTDWEDVSKTIYQSGSFGDQLDKRSYFEADIDNILSGVEDPNEKMIKIFEYAKSKMTWNGYNGIYAGDGVRSAYKTGTGNIAEINLMLTSMFRYSGLEANPVLISTKGHGIPLFPTLKGFNYVISVVEIGDGMYMFDAAEKLGQPNILDKELLNWKGRIIRENGSSNWISLNPSKLAIEAYMVDVTLDGDGVINGTVKNRLTGNKALENRKVFYGLDPDDLAGKMANRFESVKVTETKVENTTNPYEPLKIDFKIESEDLVEKIDENLYLSPLLFLTLEENPFKQEARKFPVDYGYPVKERFMVNIEIPEGYRVDNLPQGANVKMADNLISFKYLVSEGNGKIQISVNFSINSYFVPAEKYSEIKQIYQYIIDKQNEQIVLTKI